MIETLLGGKLNTVTDYLPYLSERYGAAILAAILLALSFPPYHLYVLLPLGFAVLVDCLPGADRWELVRTTAVIGFVFYFLHVYWFVNFHAMAFPGVLIVLMVYFAIWGYLLSWTGVNAWTVAGGWIVLEIITGGGFLAFPWSRVATALAVHPVLVQPVHWMGELLFGALIVFVGYTLGQVVRDRRINVRFVVSGCLLIGLVLAGYARMRTTELKTYAREVLLIQPNVMSTFSAADRSGNQLENLEELTRRHAKRGDVVVWPETALMHFPFKIGPAGQDVFYSDPLKKKRINRYVDGRIHLLSGTRFYDPRPDKLPYMNGAVLVDPNGEPSGLYTKRIMVPFGEYIPGMGQYELIEKFGRMVGTLGYRSGDYGGLLELPVGEETVPAAMQICYEDVFPDYVHRQVRDGADLLINISNDSWSRSYAAHWQHFYRARLRAIETGRTVLRNGNTGVSAVVDPLGQDHSRIDPFEKGVVREQPFKPVKKSYIVKWNSWIPYAGVLFLLAIGFWVNRSKNADTEASG